MRGGRSGPKARRRGTARSVAQILAERKRPLNSLEHLVARMALRRYLTEQIRALLPPPLADRCRSAQLRDDTLLIEVDSASWATRLRMELPKLEPGIRALGDFAGVREIHVRTSLAEAPAKTKPV